MSDARVQLLERRWRETRDPRDAAAYLQERVRIGTLTADGLRLLAYLGHPGACQALGVEPRPVVSVASFVGGLEQFGRQACVLAVRAALEVELPDPHQGGGSVGRFFAAADGWLRAPGEETLEALRRCPRPAPEPEPGSFNPTGTRDDDDVIADVTSFLADHWLSRASEGLVEAAAGPHPGRAASAAIEAVIGPRVTALSGEVLAAVQRRLVERALGPGELLPPLLPLVRRPPPPSRPPSPPPPPALGAAVAPREEAPTRSWMARSTVEPTWTWGCLLHPKGPLGWVVWVAAGYLAWSGHLLPGAGLLLALGAWGLLLARSGLR